MAPDAAGYYPIDRLLPRAVTRLRRWSGSDLAYGGVVDARSRILTISCVDGNRTDRLQGAEMVSGVGVGGQVVARGLPVVIDRRARTRADNRPDWAVLGEDIQAVFAVPVREQGEVRAVMYGAMRSRDLVEPAAVEAGLRIARLFEEFLVEQDEARLRGDPSPAGELRLTGPSMRTMCEVDAQLTELSERVDDRAMRNHLLSVRGLLESDYKPVPAPAPVLSPRETDVMRLVAQGCTNAEAAERLAVRPETVKAYLRTIMQKLGVHNRTAAVNVARRSGLLLG